MAVVSQNHGVWKQKGKENFLVELCLYLEVADLHVKEHIVILENDQVQARILFHKSNIRLTINRSIPWSCISCMISWDYWIPACVPKWNECQVTRNLPLCHEKRCSKLHNVVSALSSYHNGDQLLLQKATKIKRPVIMVSISNKQGMQSTIFYGNMELIFS